jgi:hypothetical protein
VNAKGRKEDSREKVVWEMEDVDSSKGEKNRSVYKSARRLENLSFGSSPCAMPMI